MRTQPSPPRYSRLSTDAADAAARAIDGILNGLPVRPLGELTFAHASAMSLAQLYFNADAVSVTANGIGQDYLMVPQYAVKNCGTNAWSVRYARRKVESGAIDYGFADLEIMDAIQCDADGNPVSGWAIKRMGGATSGSEITCSGGGGAESLGLGGTLQQLAVAIQLDRVCGQDPRSEIHGHNK